MPNNDFWQVNPGRFASFSPLSLAYENFYRGGASKFRCIWPLYLLSFSSIRLSVCFLEFEVQLFLDFCWLGQFVFLFCFFFFFFFFLTFLFLFLCSWLVFRSPALEFSRIWSSSCSPLLLAPFLCLVTVLAFTNGSAFVISISAAFLASASLLHVLLWDNDLAPSLVLLSHSDTTSRWNVCLLVFLLKFCWLFRRILLFFLPFVPSLVLHPSLINGKCGCSNVASIDTATNSTTEYSFTEEQFSENRRGEAMPEPNSALETREQKP